MSCIDLQMHRSAAMKALKEDEVDLKSHGRNLFQRTYNIWDHANLAKDIEQ